MTDRKPNWKKWSLIPDVEIWQAVALSLDIDPDKVRHGENNWMSVTHSYEESREFTDRVQVLASNLGKVELLPIRAINMGSNFRSKTAIVGFSAWATSVGWCVPDELKKIAVGSQSSTVEFSEEKKATWRQKDLWSEKEFQELCCGLEPNGARPNTDELNSALVAIQRAVLSKALPCIDPSDATTGDKLYGTARYFYPADAIQWAAPKFRKFPILVGEDDIIDSGSTNDADPRERQSMLMIIRALAAESEFDLSRSSASADVLIKAATDKGLTLPSRATVIKFLKAANDEF